jgi:polar amino acid transport system permease protein
MLWDTGLFLEALPKLLAAFVKITLVVTVLASVIAAGLGLVWAIALRELPRWIAAPVRFILDFIRMTPLPVHLLVVYYTFNDLSGITVGVLVFGIHYSTYMAESYRAGIESIRKGQWEAARALSLPPSRTWRAVILPQAIRNTLPSLGNWAIAMFKDTPFLIFISVPEMVTAARVFGGRNFSYIEVMTVAGLLFLLASYPTALLMRKLEKKLAY